MCWENQRKTDCSYEYMHVHVFMNESMSNVSIHTVNVSRYIFSGGRHTWLSICHTWPIVSRGNDGSCFIPGSVSDYVFYSILTCGSVNKLPHKESTHG